MVSLALPASWHAPSRESRDSLFVLALIAWTIAPHLDHLPPWVAVLVAGVLGWRMLLALRQAPLPGRTVILALLALAAALTFWGEHTLVGKQAGVTLLVVLMTLKTLELRARRDALVVFFLGFFLVLTNFLYSQSLAIAFSMAISVWGWLTALTLAHMPAGRPSLWQAARLAGRAALVGTPVMVVLFLLFPRVGPLWALPADTAHTGLSEHLRLGAVAELANDDSIAMRVRFDGPVPPPARLYFRGPVLTDTDGRDWTAATLMDPRSHPDQLPWSHVHVHGPPVRYTLSLEPTQLTWLPMLDLTPPPDAVDESGETVQATVALMDGPPLRVLADVDGQWRTRQPVAQRLRFAGRAWFDASVDATASPAELARDLALPANAHPRTREWAQRWAQDHAGPGGRRDAHALVESLYRHIGTARFTYTLTPGAYDGDAVDEFWLDRRMGFCEHFATAFTVVLRAMGIPARVVTGYQGVDRAPQDGWWIVRQSNAHAWVEYWSPERGWLRADPTAAVAPDRILRGQAIRPTPGMVGTAIEAMSPNLLERLRDLRETLDNRWNEWVLRFDRTSQFDLMRQMGVPSPDAEALGRLLISVIVGAALAGAAMAWWDAHRRSPGQRLARALAASLRPLAPHGWTVQAHESPGTLAARLRRSLGAQSDGLATRLEAIERWRYGPATAGAPASTGAADWRGVRNEARSLAISLSAQRGHPIDSTKSVPATSS
jgi:transglutaminase-like putative cysteine protease